jgi:hypothetical protein
LDLASIVTHLSPAQLRQAGIEAVGRAIVDAEEQSAQILARSRARASQLSAELAKIAAAILEALDTGRNPTYEVNQLRMLASRILSETTQPTTVPPQAVVPRPN